MISTGITQTDLACMIGFWLSLNLVLVIDVFEHKHSPEAYTKAQIKNHFIVVNVALFVFFICAYFKEPSSSEEQSEINQSKIEQRLDRIEQKLDKIDQNEKSKKDKDCDCN